MKVKVNGSEFLYFNDITISMNLDAVASTFSFTARFNPKNPIHKELFKPLSFPIIEIFRNDGRLILTGECINQNIKSKSEPELITVSGYSLPGRLEDCTIPLSAYPLESINRSLKDIANRLLEPFQIDLVIEENVINEATQIYKKTTAEPSDKVSGYLAELSSQRNIVLGHDEKGRLRMFKPNLEARPILHLTHQNTVSMGWSVNGQGMHSSIGVIRQPSDDNPNASLQDEVVNPLIRRFRPMVNVLSSGQQTDTQNAAKNKMASELRALKLQVEIEGSIEVFPGDVVEVENENVYLYQRNKFVVSSIKLSENEKGKASSLELVLPETFTGEMPNNIFE